MPAGKASQNKRDSSELLLFIRRRRGNNSELSRLFFPNLGDSLRSIRPERRKQEMMLRSLVHNLMLPQQKLEG
jgi:hypothetical protein